MRGHYYYNFPAFLDAAEKLRVAGYTVLSPAEHDLQEGFDPGRPMEEQGFDLREALRWDVAAVLRSDLLVFLPGWALSKGATAEYYVARAADIPTLSLEEALREADRA
jgi:hypothetical protein